MNRILYQLLLILFVSSTAFAQSENLTISGYIRDAANGETIIGANIYIDEIGSGTVSNEYGFYSVNLPAGTYTLSFSYVGYDTNVEQVSLTQDIRLDKNIGIESQELQEIVI